jgi:hypothetical protein
MRRSTLIAAIAVTIVAAGSFVLRSHTSTGDQPTSAVDTPGSPTSVPTVIDAVASSGPRGLPRTAAGAEQAAIAAVRMTGSIAKAGFISRADLIRSIASTRFGPMLATSSAAQLGELTTELGAAKIAAADLVWAELPLTSRVTASSDTAATVDVWSVLIVGVHGKGAARQVWRTVTVTLVWERDDWRIDSWTTTPGPTPALAATANISDVTSITNTLGWTAVRAGGEG